MNLRRWVPVLALPLLGATCNPTPEDFRRHTENVAAAEALETADRVGNAYQESPLPVVVEVGEPPVPYGLHGWPFAPAGLSNCDEMAFYRIQAGLPDRFQSLGYRESNCRNEDGVHTFCCWGYWQAHSGNWFGTSYAPYFRDWCQAYSYRDVNSDNPLEKQKQACVARVMFDISGYRPWAL